MPEKEIKEAPCGCEGGSCGWKHVEAADEAFAPSTGHRLRETGNGPTVSYEEALLREYFGEPDENGVYR
ncbi:hypothetical protein [Streptomyces sp. S1]|uniref:hypothetical protein n=1 Tax=Streptomyces sp. S1 TaxID=718288 RepID=UPI003D73DA26